MWKQWVAGAAVVIILGGGTLYLRRHNRIEWLYERVCGLPPAFEGTVQAQAAVRELATYRGNRVTELLLNIAFGRAAFPWPAVQSEAIQALAKRGDPNVSTRIASLLQPHWSIIVRQAAANALQTGACAEDCVKSILHYLERMSSGDVNRESTIRLPESIRESVSTRMAKDQMKLYETLYGVLKQNPRSTMLVFRDVYGIGTDTPSRSGLVLVGRTLFREACPELTESNRLIAGSADQLKGAQNDLEVVLRSLGCPPQ